MIYGIIRTIAMRKRKFRITDLVPPLMTKPAENALRQLTVNGELVRVKKILVKRDGTWDIQGVYSGTKHLRPAELTNRQL